MESQYRHFGLEPSSSYTQTHTHTPAVHTDAAVRLAERPPPPHPLTPIFLTQRGAEGSGGASQAVFTLGPDKGTDPARRRGGGWGEGGVWGAAKTKKCCRRKKCFKQKTGFFIGPTDR